ncbi:MAG: ATP synthase F1 subunit delta [Candidatus Midichloria sp.]|uniref:Oligomycin sensitivity conferral protein n=1 Tax=Hyalomma marginatum TaxID=34627 RepID=A0A8S4C4D9_9ACAR|nr:F0F1 ATP synthase subunit delta [Hyalomma marginatum]CAG7599907.1 F0F1 ATP synthase subunit delta [Hyalomma marginatum]
MILQKSIIKKYAKTLYEIAKEQSSIESIKKDLNAISEKLSNNKHYKKLMFSQFSPYKMKKMFINTALDGLNIREITRNFIEVLLVNNRINMLDDMLKCFNEIILSESGIVKANLTVCPHQEDISQFIEEQLESVSGKEILLESEENKEILGGFIIRVGNKVLDYSLRNRLNKLKKYLNEGKK